MISYGVAVSWTPTDTPKVSRLTHIVERSAKLMWYSQLKVSYAVRHGIYVNLKSFLQFLGIPNNYLWCYRRPQIFFNKIALSYSAL